jgi:hypothetical protein
MLPAGVPAHQHGCTGSGDAWTTYAWAFSRRSSPSSSSSLPPACDWTTSSSPSSTSDITCESSCESSGAPAPSSGSGMSASACDRADDHGISDQELQADVCLLAVSRIRHVNCIGPLRTANKPHHAGQAVSGSALPPYYLLFRSVLPRRIRRPTATPVNQCNSNCWTCHSSCCCQASCKSSHGRPQETCTQNHAFESVVGTESCMGIPPA